MSAPAAKLETKIATLDTFKDIVGKFVQRLGDPSKFEYRGEVIDLGEYGKGKCTCDHPVRYMFLIWGPNGEVAPVGCECIKHFAAYNQALFEKLEQARTGLFEALAREEREAAEAVRMAQKDSLYPAFRLARAKFLAVCRMHEERISYYIPKPMWLMQSDVRKAVPAYKTTNGYIKFYKKVIQDVETMLGMYERGELK